MEYIYVKKREAPVGCAQEKKRERVCVRKERAVGRERAWRVGRPQGCGHQAGEARGARLARLYARPRQEVWRAVRLIILSAFQSHQFLESVLQIYFLLTCQS